MATNRERKVVAQVGRAAASRKKEEEQGADASRSQDGVAPAARSRKASPSVSKIVASLKPAAAAVKMQPAAAAAANKLNTLPLAKEARRQSGE